MNKREMKKALKYFLAREIFLSDALQEKFLLLEGLTVGGVSEATKTRLHKLILELREEAQ